MAKATQVVEILTHGIYVHLLVVFLLINEQQCTCMIEFFFFFICLVDFLLLIKCFGFFII